MKQIVIHSEQVVNQRADRVLKREDGDYDYPSLSLGGVEFVSVEVLNEVRKYTALDIADYYERKIEVIEKQKKEIELEVAQLADQLENLRKYSSMINPMSVLHQLYHGGNVGIYRKMKSQREFKNIKYRSSVEVTEWLGYFDTIELFDFIGNERWAKYSLNEAKEILRKALKLKNISEERDA